MSLPEGVLTKKERALSILRQHRRVLVALSGGVDSAVLLALAAEALGGGNVLAVTGRSSSVTGEEIDDARKVADFLGVRHEIVETFELARPEYRANTGDRCLHCRTELFEILGAMAVERGYDAVAYGAIVDDLGDRRPGMAAARGFGVLDPLLSANISKNDVRVLAESIDLHVQDKPASACLASRIPEGTEVTPERLAQVGRAEAALKRMGFSQVRVRHHGEIARIELGEGEDERLRDAGVRAAAVKAVHAAGFRFAVLDLEGYRTGGSTAGGTPTLYSIGPQREGGQ